MDDTLANDFVALLLRGKSDKLENNNSSTNLMEDTTQTTTSELGEGLKPDAGRSPDHEVTWPRLSVLLVAFAGSALLVWAYFSGE